MQKTTTSRLLNRGGIADLPFLRTLLTIRQKVPRAKFLESDGLFCVISICKFGSFRNPFAMVTSLSELYFRFRRFILLVHLTKWFLWTMTAAQAAENHGDERGLTWYLYTLGFMVHNAQGVDISTSSNLIRCPSEDFRNSMDNISERFDICLNNYKMALKKITF